LVGILYVTSVETSDMTVTSGPSLSSRKA